MGFALVSEERVRWPTLGGPQRPEADKEKLFHAGVSKIEIERPGQKVKVIIHTARPGINHRQKRRRGGEAQEGNRGLYRQAGCHRYKRVRKPELDSQLVAENIALQLEKEGCLQACAEESSIIWHEVRRSWNQGAVCGRLAGAEIARTEWYKGG